jgi:hypothetical protein
MSWPSSHRFGVMNENAGVVETFLRSAHGLSASD